MKALVLWAAKNAFIAIMICLGIIAMGFYAAKELAIDAVPDVTNIQVQVVTRASAGPTATVTRRRASGRSRRSPIRRART